MARNGSGVYSLPAGSTIANGDTSDASDINTPLADIASDLNVARPIVAGGTGADNAVDALVNLGLTATAAEINTLDGITATTAELNLTDGATAGTVVNSKAVVYGASGEVASTSLDTSDFTIGGVDAYTLKAVQYLTSGTAATYTTPTNCRALRVFYLGAGGGAGGVDGQGAGTCGASGGAQGGAWGIKLITSPAATYTYTIGAPGIGGTAGANSGTNGGNTTFTDGASLTLTAEGGVASSGVTASSTYGVSAGSSGSAATGGDLNVSGMAGSTSIRSGGDHLSVGVGGGSPYGRGGVPASILNGQNGDGATGYGAGGSPAVARGVATNYAGGDGSGGLIIIEELF